MTAADAAQDGEILRFDLDWRDALAWERVDPRHRRRGRVAVAASLFAGIGLVRVTGSHLADLRWLHSVPMAAVFILMPAVAVLLLQTQAAARRARDRFPRVVRVETEISPSRVVQRVAGDEAAVRIGAKSLREVVVRADHIFLSNGTDVAILPARAFGSGPEKDAFAARWRQKLRD